MPSLLVKGGGGTLDFEVLRRLLEESGITQQLYFRWGYKYTDMKLTISERKFKGLSENVYFYPPLMYSC